MEKFDWETAICLLKKLSDYDKQKFENHKIMSDYCSP